MQECRFNIDNTYVHYVKAEGGPKSLVIISGISLRGFEGLGASIARQYKAFLNDYTLYMFDRRKHINKKISIEDLAEDVYKALQAEGVNSAHFIGFSQGGMICMEMALLHPEMVSSLILGSTSARADAKSLDTGKKWSKWLAKGDVHNFNLEFYKSIYSPSYNEKYHRAFDKLAHMGTTDECRRFEFLLDSMSNLNLIPRLKEIKCPCYVIAAENDETLGPKASREIADALGCPCLVYPEGSHAVFDEDPNYTQKLFEIEKSFAKE